MNMITYGSGTAQDPWVLKTPPQTSDYLAWHNPVKDELVCQVGSTKLSYQWRCIADLHVLLLARGDWVLLGNADEGKPTASGSVEAWARDEANPVGGYYGPPVMELLGLAEVEHNARNNRMRAL